MNRKPGYYWEITQKERDEIKARAKQAARDRYAAMTAEERAALSARNNERAKQRDDRVKRSEQNRAYREKVKARKASKADGMTKAERRRRSEATMARFAALPLEAQIERRRRLCLHQARMRALRAKVPFRLKPSDVEWTPVCPILGQPLVHAGPDWRWNPSLDRKVPELGYVPGNCFIISRLANSMKNCADAPLLRSFIENMPTYMGWKSDGREKDTPPK